MKTAGKVALKQFVVFDVNRVGVPFAYCIVHIFFQSTDLRLACSNERQDACRKAWPLTLATL